MQRTQQKKNKQTPTEIQKNCLYQREREKHTHTETQREREERRKGMRAKNKYAYQNMDQHNAKLCSISKQRPNSGINNESN